MASMSERASATFRAYGRGLIGPDNGDCLAEAYLSRPALHGHSAALR